ncbi:hypothetical protein HU200_025312 [Digitaria exilis]|uniref:DUF1618 domain-containing protein n=1 Tax=Digitaria exilis TaxID=1010633 RepID=A0A835C122_9POAL|nr:hypothetical protein HU200_025312 [Digitaria exilis]
MPSPSPAGAAMFSEWRRFYEGRTFSERGTFIDPASLNLPILPAPVAATSSGSSGWFMLDKQLYIGDEKNGTFAQAITRTGPAVTDLSVEPQVVCVGMGIVIIRVTYTLGVRPIESVDELSKSDCDYLVYRAHTEPPSLDVLPKQKPRENIRTSEIGFFPCGGDGEEEHFVLAYLRARLVHLQYDLHVFSSQTNTWATRPAMLEPPYPGYKGDYLVHDDDRVLTLEGGLLGWVDLWRGILLCSVLDADPVVRYIRFPAPLEGNKWMHIDNEPHQNARPVRDVTFSDGFIKLVEMEYCHSMHASAAGPYTHEGWTIVTWKRELSSDSWKQDCTAYVSTSSILPLLRHDHSFCWALDKQEMAGPLRSTHGGDVVYLMAKEYFDSNHAWAIAFTNIRESKLEGVTSFPEERHALSRLAYQPFALSKFLNTASSNCRVADVCWIPESEVSKNDPDNTMVLVEGLDPCVTVNQLKGIAAMFGELCYLRIDADKQCGLLKYVRSSVHH